jgi:hypothetical protein
MYNPRYNGILASTALALILAAPLLSTAKNDEQPAAAPLATTPAEPALTQAPVADPLASLDPADRAVAEKIRQCTRPFQWPFYFPLVFADHRSNSRDAAGASGFLILSQSDERPER